MDPREINMNPYEVLGVPRDATPEQLRLAFDERIEPTTAGLVQVHLAYEILSNETRRAALDARLRGETPSFGDDENIRPELLGFNPYEVLAVGPDATPEEIRQAFLATSNSGPAVSLFRHAVALTMLSDGASRAAVDARLQALEEDDMNYTQLPVSDDGASIKEEEDSEPESLSALPAYRATAEEDDQGEWFVPAADFERHASRIRNLSRVPEVLQRAEGVIERLKDSFYRIVDLRRNVVRRKATWRHLEPMLIQVGARGFILSAVAAFLEVLLRRWLATGHISVETGYIPGTQMHVSTLIRIVMAADYIEQALEVLEAHAGDEFPPQLEPSLEAIYQFMWEKIPRRRIPSEFYRAHGPSSR
ncbi:hypothetical protein QBC47DRAFT_412119 [Echria macrotheca]|uniref:J domain-containing protein n=1 Tax=Echria macrotheca TaxID=438768 RepID=A0AAJ0BEF6_9PEZI|nr:hypothetical protein QBC47DRAFT_412119 [Echria macrotheca]